MNPILGMIPIIAAPMFVLAILVGAVVFIVWLISEIFQMIWYVVSGTARGFGRLIAPPLSPPMMQQFPPAPAVRQCRLRGCYNLNPADARFCARCGSPLDVSVGAPARRAAMFAARGPLS